MCDLGRKEVGKAKERDESKLQSLHLLYYHEIWLCSMCKLVNFSACLLTRPQCWKIGPKSHFKEWRSKIVFQVKMVAKNHEMENEIF